MWWEVAWTSYCGLDILPCFGVWIVCDHYWVIMTLICPPTRQIMFTNLVGLLWWLTNVASCRVTHYGRHHLMEQDRQTRSLCASCYLMRGIIKFLPNLSLKHQSGSCVLMDRLYSRIMSNNGRSHGSEKTISKWGEQRWRKRKQTMCLLDHGHFNKHTANWDLVMIKIQFKDNEYVQWLVRIFVLMGIQSYDPRKLKEEES